MALGIVFIARTPGYNVDLMSYLFGNILLIPSQDLIVLAVLDVVIVGLVILFYKQILAVTFDEQFALLRGVRVEFFYLMLLCLVALTVVILIQVVGLGLILVIALLTLPAAIAGLYTRSLTGMILLATALAILFTSIGLVMSYELVLPSGATVILVAGISYLMAVIGAGTIQNRSL